MDHSLLIYRPLRDGWLSWPCWLTDSGRLNRKVVTHLASSLVQDRESSLAETSVLTTICYAGKWKNGQTVARNTRRKFDDFVRAPASRDVFVDGLPDGGRAIFDELFVLETERGHVGQTGR